VASFCLSGDEDCEFRGKGQVKTFTNTDVSTATVSLDGICAENGEPGKAEAEVTELRSWAF
jgi:hypothetical protein